jgi:hypothetical protein
LLLLLLQEYLSAEIIEASFKASRSAPRVSGGGGGGSGSTGDNGNSNGITVITAEHVMEAMRADEELSVLFRCSSVK